MPSDLRSRFSPAALFFQVVTLSLLCLSCGEDSGDEDHTAPPAPRMRLKSCGDPLAAWPESGVDADASSGQGVRVEWDMAVEPEDLAAFQVFRAWHPDSTYERLVLDEERFLEGRPPYYHFVDLDPGLRPELHVGSRAWYYVRAVDGDGNASAPSDTVSYRLWAAPRIFQSQVSVASDTLQVEWQYEFVDMFQAGFRGFTLLVVDDQGNLEAVREIQLNLEPAMRVRYAVGDLGLSSGAHRLRVDTRIETVAQIDSVYVHVASNPSWCTLAGSESNWISFTF